MHWHTVFGFSRIVVLVCDVVPLVKTFFEILQDQTYNLAQLRKKQIYGFFVGSLDHQSESVYNYFRQELLRIL